MKTENVCFIINSPFSFPYLIIGVIKRRYNLFLYVPSYCTCTKYCC